MNYTQIARKFVLGQQDEVEKAMFGLMRAEKTVEALVPASYNTHASLQRELPQKLLVPAQGYYIGSDFIGITKQRCIDDLKPRLIYISENNYTIHEYKKSEFITFTSSEKINSAYDSEAWSVFKKCPENRNVLEYLFGITNGLRTDIALQNEFTEIFDIARNHVYSQKAMWMESVIIARGDPKEAFSIIEKAAGVSFTEDDREKWNRTSEVQPHYKELIALIEHKDIDRYRKAMNLLETLWAPVAEQRIAYAHANGFRVTERDPNMTDIEKEAAKKLMILGYIPIPFMEEVGEGSSSRMKAFLIETKNKETREKLLTRTAGRN